MNNQTTHNMAIWADNIFQFFDWTQQYAYPLSLLAGVTLPFIFLRQKEAVKSLTFFIRGMAIIGFFCLFFGSLSPWTLGGLSNLYFIHPSHPIDLSDGTASWWLLGMFTFGGMFLHIFFRRLAAPDIDRLKHRLIKKTRLERNQRTDVRSVKSLLPETTHYDPMKHIDLTKGIFIGLDDQRQPQYIPVDIWQKQHADIIGTTGAGKGVASGMLLYQSILAGEGVFVMDPKNDEWAPHLFKKACLDANKPFLLIDLNKLDYQINLIDGINQEHLEELFIAGFGLSEKGEAADFYRIDDRRAARASAQFIAENPGSTIRDIYNSDYVQGIHETIKGFFGKIEELALMDSINSKGGATLKDIFDDGGCCYVIGSMRNSKVIAAQRMILVRLLQLAELRDRVKETPLPIAIFLDELKYHLSRPALEGLGAARDKGVHIIMAHQSIADLRDCPADLNGDSVVGAVVENAKFKLVYKLQDPDTADWISRMSGTILVDDESRTAKTNNMLTETMDDKRTIRQAERHYVDSNMLLNLPPFVCYIFTATALPKASLIAPVKVKKEELVVLSVKQDTIVKMKNPVAAKDVKEDKVSPAQLVRSSETPSSPANASSSPHAVEAEVIPESKLLGG